MILVHQYSKGDDALKKDIYRIYLENTKYINNWDLVDLSAGKIVGAHLWDRNREVLKKLARSGSLWERRIAMIACGHFINKRDYETPFEIAKLLLTDNHDLVHKAVGWMLREIGKRDLAAEKKFLDAHYTEMPRTMLRYAIEKFNPKLRTEYMKGLR
jgi:3-methyladenine DNA glycosylase AlkD